MNTFYKRCLTGAMLLLLPWAALAAPTLTIQRLTWNINGLDSNDETTGPDTFISGVRVCNTGDQVATNLVVDFVWNSTNTFINLADTAQLTLDTLDDGACQDFYFNVQITRTNAAYDTVRDFHISADADNASSVLTATNEQIYVEHLISQNRNAVISVTGPTNVVLGSTFTIVTTNKTATQGYEQLTDFFTMPNDLFRVESIDVQYSAPSGASNDTVYADACGWDADKNSATYNSCIGPVNYGSGKAGGNPIVTTYTFTAVGLGASDVFPVLYDFSGSSYHYNSDFGAGFTINVVQGDADIGLTKSVSDPLPDEGDSIAYTIIATNAGPDNAYGLVVTDTVPVGVTFVSSNSADYDEVTGLWTIGDLPVATSTSLTINATVDSGTLGTTITNTASVSALLQNDPNSTNDSSSATIHIPAADLAVFKTADPDPAIAGAPLTYTIVVTNSGPDIATGVLVNEFLPAGVTLDSFTPSRGSYDTNTMVWTVGSLTNSTSENLILNVTLDPDL